MASAYTNGESEDGEFLAVYLVRGSVLSLSFVEPHKRDRPRKSDEPDPRHALRNGFGHRFTSRNSECPHLFF